MSEVRPPASRPGGGLPIFTGFYRQPAFLPSDRPFVTVEHAFLGGNLPVGLGELDVADLAVDLGAELRGDRVEACGGNLELVLARHPRSPGGNTCIGETNDVSRPSAKSRWSPRKRRRRPAASQPASAKNGGADDRCTSTRGRIGLTRPIFYSLSNTVPSIISGHHETIPEA